MIILLSLLITTSAVLHLRTNHTNQQTQIYLFKPPTTTLLIMSTYFTAQWLNRPIHLKSHLKKFLVQSTNNS